MKVQLCSRVGIRAAFDCAARGCDQKGETYSLPLNDHGAPQQTCTDAKVLVPLPFNWINSDGLIYCPMHSNKPVDQELRLVSLLDYTALTMRKTA